MGENLSSDNENSFSLRQLSSTGSDVYSPMIFRTSFVGLDLFA